MLALLLSLLLPLIARLLKHDVGFVGYTSLFYFIEVSYASTQFAVMSLVAKRFHRCHLAGGLIGLGDWNITVQYISDYVDTSLVVFLEAF